MYFNVYDVSDLSDAELDLLDATDDSYHDNDYDLVEMGLSSGEIRQSILDRIRQDVRDEEISYINLSLQDFDYKISEDLLDTEEGQKSIIEDIDSILYDVEDEDLVDTVWIFSNSAIWVVEEE